MIQNNESSKQNDLVMNDDGKLYFNPYNSNNIEITESIIQRILLPHLGYNYKIHNIELFKEHLYIDRIVKLKMTIIILLLQHVRKIVSHCVQNQMNDLNFWVMVFWN